MLRLLLILVFLPTLSVFAGDLPSDAAKYVEQYESENTKLRKALVVNLNKAMVKATKAGDLNAANAIKAKIEETEKSTLPTTDLLGNASLSSRVVGKWLWTNTECVFDKNGGITGRSGTWKIEDQNIILLVNGWVCTMTIGDDGNMTGTRNDSARVVLTRIK